MSVRSVLSIAAAVVSLAAPAVASTLTITSVSGVWQDASIDVVGEGTSSIRWGKPAEDYKSAYIFRPASTDFVAEEDEDFVLGTFIHFNNPIYGPFLSSVDLAVEFTIEGLVDPITSVFSFAHWETLNSATPCANGAPNGTGVNSDGCADRVTATLNESKSEIFEIGGISYVLDVSGFIYDGGLMTQFWTREKKANAAQLIASFTAIKGEVPPPVVPLPASAFLLLGGLGGLAALRRKG